MKNNLWPVSLQTLQKLFFGTVSGILILPIIVLPPTFSPSNWSRVILFKLALIWLLAYLWYRFLYKRDISFFVFNKKNPAFLPWLILGMFLLTVVISTVFSEDMRHSLFGSPGRAGGVINLTFYFLFALGLSIFINEQYWEKLIKVNFAVGIIASFFAIIQYVGFLPAIFTKFSEGGIPSLIGNSTPLAMYMIFMVFSAFTFFIKEHHKKKKWGYGALVILFLFTILITGSRAAYLGMVVASLFYLLLYPKKIKTLKMAAVCMVVLGILTVLIFNFFPQLGQAGGLLKTASSRLSFEKIVQDLTGNRMPAWVMTWHAIQEKPLLGWGAENFYIGFEKYYQPTNETLQREWWDRPHNILLDVAVHYGILALLLYVAFWALLLIKLQNFKKNEPDPNKTQLAHGLQAMFLGYTTALLFNFDEFPTYLMAFFFIGLSLCLISQHGQKTELLPSAKNIFGKKPVGIVLLALTALFVWFWNIKPLYANEKTIYANRLISAQRCDEALLIAETTWEKAGILKTYSALTFADFVKRCAEQTQKKYEYIQKAIEALKQASALQPNYSRTWILMGAFTNVLAADEQNLQEKNQRILQARQYLQKALELSPQRIEILIQLQINDMLAKDYLSMEKTAKECIQINPRLGTCYWYLGLAQIFMKEKTKGEQNLAQSKAKGFTAPPLLQLANAYLASGYYGDAAKIYDDLAANYGNADFYAVSALLAKKLGDYPKAAKAALQVFKMQPNNQESLQFLEELFTISKDPALKESSLYSIAQIYKETGEKTNDTEMLTKSKDVYLRLIGQYPYKMAYRWSLVDLYLLLENYLKAREELINIVTINANERGRAQGYLHRMPIAEPLKILP